MVTPSARQSGEFLRKAEEFVRRLGIKVRGDGDNEISILFPNGARHLSNAIFKQQRIGPTSEPAGIRDCCLKAGRMLSGGCTPTDRSGRSGITSATGGLQTRACGSITCCFRRQCATDSWMQARDSNTLPLLRKGEQFTFAQWSEHFLEAFSKPPFRARKTHLSYTRVAKHLNAGFGEVLLVDLTADVIETCLRRRLPS